MQGVGDHTDQPRSYDGGGAGGIGHVMAFGSRLTMKIVSGIHWKGKKASSSSPLQELIS
jgi:hypothetical protein